MKNCVYIIVLYCNLPYSNYLKILYTNLCDKLAYANTANPDQITPDQNLQCLQFNWELYEKNAQ